MALPLPVIKGEYLAGRPTKAAGSHLSAHFKYNQYRKLGEQERREDRFLFDQENDRVRRQDAVHDVMTHTSSKVLYHKIMLSPGEHEHIDDFRLMKSPSQLACDVAVSFMASLSNNPKLLGSILADMASRLFMLRNPSIVAVTSRDEFDFENMIEEPTAIYLCILASDSQCLKWLSAAFFMQLMTCLTKRAESSSPDGFLSG